MTSTMTKPIRVLSLGAGVQSTALLLMSIRGELPRVDHAVFADTKWEPAAVYTHLEWLRGMMEQADIPFHCVSAGNLRDDALSFRRHRKSADGKRWASMPLFVLNGDGSQGLLRRQCTSEYKIAAIERAIRRNILGLAHGQRIPPGTVVEQWMGITWDERERMKRPAGAWSVHVYPFCDMAVDRDGNGDAPGMFGQRWTREDCVNWLAANYPDRTIPRSACIGCPYRSNAEWRHMRDTDPAAWRDAIEFDRAIREEEEEAHRAGVVRVKGLPFVHREMKPLGEVDLSPSRDASLWDGIADNECEGMCGV